MPATSLAEILGLYSPQQVGSTPAPAAPAPEPTQGVIPGPSDLARFIEEIKNFFLPGNTGYTSPPRLNADTQSDVYRKYSSGVYDPRGLPIDTAGNPSLQSTLDSYGLGTMNAATQSDLYRRQATAGGGAAADAGYSTLLPQVNVNTGGGEGADPYADVRLNPEAQSAGQAGGSPAATSAAPSGSGGETAGGAAQDYGTPWDWPDEAWLKVSASTVGRPMNQAQAREWMMRFAQEHGDAMPWETGPFDDTNNMLDHLLALGESEGAAASGGRYSAAEYHGNRYQDPGIAPGGWEDMYYNRYGGPTYGPNGQAVNDWEPLYPGQRPNQGMPDMGIPGQAAALALLRAGEIPYSQYAQLGWGGRPFVPSHMRRAMSPELWPPTPAEEELPTLTAQR